ncbi:hypothetical protein [Vibrio phage vB_VhaP_PG11]|nr:hypothetical protein [Vibrio phage vB_VhaP_PG11]
MSRIRILIKSKERDTELSNGNDKCMHYSQMPFKTENRGMYMCDTILEGDCSICPFDSMKRLEEIIYVLE